MAQFQINRYKDVPIRPLTKGMFKDLPPNGIPMGGFEDIKNLRVKTGYLETRGGFHPYFNGKVNLSGNDLIAYDYGNLREKLQNLVYKWKTNGQSETLLISDDFLYTVNDQTSISHVLFTSGSITVTGDSVTDGILTFTISAGNEDNIAVGDYVREFGQTTVFGRVININAGTYSVELDPSYTWSTTAIEFIHAFQTAPGFMIDYTFLGGYSTVEAGNEMILCDNAERGLYVYDGATLGIYATDSSPLGDGIPANQTLQSAKACTFFDDRLWIGNVTETTGNNFPQRIWWSDVLNYKRFDPANYIDLPYTQGELLSIQPLGPNLILYFVDTIFIGRPTSIVGRPYEFQEINTDGIGLVSQLAIATWLDGHFFVGQDDIYAFTQSRGLERIGSPVERETLVVTKDLGLLDYVQVEPDPLTDSIVFLFPNVPEDTANAVGLSTKLWRFYYKTKAWAYDEVPYVNDVAVGYFSCISQGRTVTKQDTYQDWYDLDGTAGDPDVQTSGYTAAWGGDASLNAVYWEDGTASGTPPAGQQEWINLESYDDLNSFKISSPRLFIGTYFVDTAGYYIQNIHYESIPANKDNIDGTEYDINYQLISPDYDFGYPDRAKMTRQFSVRTIEHADDFFQPQVWTSDGKARLNQVTGNQDIWWMAAPSVKFFTDYNEGKTGFLTRGSLFKFKIQFTRSSERYRITEFIIRTMIEGEQTDA